MKKITYEQALLMLVLGLIGCCVGLTIIFAAEHHKRVQYEQAACVLSDVVRRTIGHERNLEEPICDEMYEEVIDNLDCYNVCIDKDFIENLYWAY